MLKRLFAAIPYLEVLVRIVYKDCMFRSKFWLKFIKKKRKADKRKNFENIQYTWGNVISYVRELGIGLGDIIIVHSDMKNLEKFKIPPNEIIDELIQLVGENGTVVMPAFPYYRENGNGRLKFDEYDEEVKEYDPQSTYAWTGMLPNVMCTYGNAVRSQFPKDSLVAIGAHANQMMEHNIEGMYPHGSKSSWEYCAEHNAKILWLGVSAAESFSAAHLAEDYLGDNFPIKGWYTTQRFRIKHGDQWIYKDIKVRKKFWTRYVTEYHSLHCLKKAGLFQENRVEDTLVGYVDNIRLIRDYMLERIQQRNLVFYQIPGKYWKSNKK